VPDGVFQAEVVSPEAALVETPATALVLRSSDGDLTILDGHTALVTDVVPGEVRIDLPEGDPIRLAVHGGYLQVETGAGLDRGPEMGGVTTVGGTGGSGTAQSTTTGERSTRVTLLAGVAERAEDIDVPRAERAREIAQARIEELQAIVGRTERPAVSEGAEEAPSEEEQELAEAEAALRRAEVRLEVAGVTSGTGSGN
jgi:F-type H+-transporting ATPase subunit epsilon